MTQLDQLRVVEAKDPQRVLDLLKRGTDALADARRQVMDETAAPSTAPAPRGRKPDPAQAAAVAQRRLNLCQIAFVQAELHRRAALALPADHPQRAANLDAALAQCKSLRIDYRDLVAGRLGYAGEARVHRAKGDLAQADAVLASVTTELDDRRLAQQPAPLLAVQRVLWLERVETALAKSLPAGTAMAGQLEKSALIKDASPAEQAALKWTVAEAAANAAIASKDGDADAIAGQLRDAMKSGGAPEHQALALLVKLSAARGVKLTASEQLAWARLQSWAGLAKEALGTYAAAVKDDPARVAPGDWIAYGAQLHAAGRAEDAADALAKGLASIPPDAPNRVAVLQAIANGRVQLARQKDADAAKRTLAIDALWALAEAAKDANVRREALRSWAHFQQQAGTLDDHLPALAKFQLDVQADPFLCLLASDARWRMSVATTQRTAARAQLAQSIQSDLSRLLPQADPNLAPSLVLLMAQVAAASPGGARVALDVLAQHDTIVKVDAPATAQLIALKLRALMDLGLTAEAEALAARVEGAAISPATALRLADMLADRHASAATVPPAARDRVVQLVSRALAQQGRDAKYRDATLAGARTLLKVKAYADAQQLLGGLKADGVKDIDVSMLTAAALQGQGKIEDANKLLAAVAREHPDAGEVHLATGRLQQDLQQWEPAGAAYRLARKQLGAGSDGWWQATVGLGECLSKQGNIAGASELLRVANAMYRTRAPATLLPRIDALLKPAAGAGAVGRSD
jgi:hypothetical protein